MGRRLFVRAALLGIFDLQAGVLWLCASWAPREGCPARLGALPHTPPAPATADEVPASDESCTTQSRRGASQSVGQSAVSTVTIHVLLNSPGQTEFGALTLPLPSEPFFFLLFSLWPANPPC